MHVGWCLYLQAGQSALALSLRHEKIDRDITKLVVLSSLRCSYSFFSLIIVLGLVFVTLGGAQEFES